MADTTHTPERPSPATLGREVNDLALEVQMLARRMGSLAYALDNEIDNDGGLESDGRCGDYVNLIMEIAKEAADKGERIEILSGRILHD